MELRVFGIRHHGPGSAKRLARALRQFSPDVLLVELPEDAADLTDFIGQEGLKPPVAMLIYDPKDFSRASYLPFAEFSPEWIAMKYANRQEVPIRAMDLSLGRSLSLSEDQSVFQTADSEMRALRQDPMGVLARLAGYQDSERWWEVMFESRPDDLEVFDAVLEMMTFLRQETAQVESDQTLIREAQMRETLRKVDKEGFERVAVVCGAWHAPVLASWEDFKVKDDKQWLRKTKKKKTNATWVPWSFDRLSLSGGYRAGVISPAWYQLLFRRPEQASVRWMARAARLLRKEDLNASSARVIDAVQLAGQLATIRQLELPGLEELEDAALSSFCEGKQPPLELIREKLAVGDVIGKIPADIPQVPLQQDLEKTIRSARLSKEYQTTEAITKELDLRKDSNRTASRLLHRLLLLNIPWGQARKGSQFKLGSFSEVWRLKWRPDYAIRVIEAGMWGNTVEEAATVRATEAGASCTHLAELTALIDRCLRAELEAALPGLVKELRDRAAQASDVLELMDALEPLVHVLQYGDTRGRPIEGIRSVVAQLVPRICIGLPVAAVSINDEVATELWERLLTFNHNLGLLQVDEYSKAWESTLGQLVDLSGGHLLIRGAAARFLLDLGRADGSITEQRFAYHLSPGSEAVDGARWLEGFLQGSGLLLIHQPALWSLLDHWIDQTPMNLFEEVLPVLKRTFSRFSESERKEMMRLVRQGQAGIDQHREASRLDAERAEVPVAVWKKLMGQ
jgi:hypothetical protein